MDLHGVWRHFAIHNIHMDMDMAACLHIITVTYFRYQNRPIQNRYHIAMACFRLLPSGYDMEVMILVYDAEMLLRCWYNCSFISYYK